MTYGERRKRADVKQILRDMDLLESAFLSKTQKLNEKRQEQLMKRVEKMLPEVESAYEKGDTEEVAGILATLQIPSGKEWRKNIHSLVDSSARAGVLRAHMELLRLREFYEFDENEWTVDIEDGGTEFEVVFPPEAEEWIRKYGYEIGTITEETVRERIRKEIHRGLTEGLRDKDLIANVRKVADTWLSPAHAETIARTETAKMYNAGRIARWLDPDQNGFVEALQYDAIVDTRTTDLCKSLDGKIIAVANTRAIAEYTPPNHFKCRATWIPVTKYEEWADDFPLDESPQKGFVFDAPLPHMLRGKTEPLVRPKKSLKLDPRLIKDPDLIRSMPDLDFKIAIGNIEDQELKLGMIKERAEMMLINKGIIEQTVKDNKFSSWGVVDGEASFLVYGRDYKAPVPTRSKKIIAEFLFELENYPYDNDKMLGAVDKFVSKHGHKPSYMGFIAKIKEATKVQHSIQFNGFKEVASRSTEAHVLLKIRKPPLTANFRDATGLRQAVADGQSWMEKYVDDKLVPKTGIKLKFKHDLRRAYATGGNGEIFFGKYETDAGVVVHESAHVMHWNNKAVASLTNTFFMKRTNKMTIAKKEWGNSEGGKEWAFPDDFTHYYTGRVYGWEKRFSGVNNQFTDTEFYGQEVVSMGLQNMYTDPQKFYEDDKEHFLFMYALMEGLF